MAKLTVKRDPLIKHVFCGSKKKTQPKKKSFSIIKLLRWKLSLQTHPKYRGKKISYPKVLNVGLGIKKHLCSIFFMA